MSDETKIWIELGVEERRRNNVEWYWVNTATLTYEDQTYKNTGNGLNVVNVLKKFREANPDLDPVVEVGREDNLAFIPTRMSMWLKKKPQPESLKRSRQSFKYEK